MTKRDIPLVYTPSNEPYLGRPALKDFDDLIVACLKSNEAIAARTYSIELTELQTAACQLIPAGISLSLSIRELIRQGYLYGALVMVRPLAERTVILAWLWKFPQHIDIWKNGWKHGERKSLARMLEDLGGEKLAGKGGNLTRTLNSLTHGDPASSIWNLVMIGGKPGYAVSKILDNPVLCDKASIESAMFLSLLHELMIELFPEIK